MKILIVDDHPIFRMGARHILASIPGCHVVGEADDTPSALALIDQLSPDLLLMDIVMPGTDGVAGTAGIRARYPGLRVLIMSAHAQLTEVIGALDAGAAGLIIKSDGAEALLEAVTRVMRGERYLSPSIRDRMSAYDRRHRRGTGLLAVLTEREREIFGMAAHCRAARQIASDLGIARKTVDTHLNRIYRKLGLRNLAELVRLATNLGLTNRMPPKMAPPADASGAVWTGPSPSPLVGVDQPGDQEPGPDQALRRQAG